jgi:DNA-binding LacI/PurR family transcriptional regulator
MDGALVYSCQTDSPARDWLLRRKLPLVFVDQDPVAGIPSVNVDDKGGAQAAAQHLVELGHRRVGILTTSVDGPVGVLRDPLTGARGHGPKQRLLGWLDALGAAGIEPTVVQVPHNGEDEARDGAQLLLATAEQPTAVLCFSDLLARGVLHVADDLGLEVPRDLSVVGFDDSPLSRQARPALTTVQQDVVAKGRAAAAALTSAIERARSGVAGRARHVVLPTRLIVRESTAPPGFH